MRLLAASLVGALVACSRDLPVQRVDLAPAPTATASEVAEAPTNPPNEPACKPEALVAVGADGSGRLDAAMLKQAIDLAKGFAERCCNGDESGDATVVVTVSPDGYATEVKIEPELLATGPTGACLYASFHRVVTKSFQGSAVSVTVPVHVRR
jgi:hypothetical protein